MLRVVDNSGRRKPAKSPVNAGRLGRCLAMLCVLSIFGSGCLAGLFSRSSSQQALAWGVAVYPVYFKFPIPQYLAYLRGQSIADRLNSATTSHVYGPADFRIQIPESPDLTEGTDLETAVRFTRTRPPMGLYALRVTVAWADRGWDDTQTGDVQPSELDGEIRVKADLLSFAEHAVVKSLESVVHHKPQFSVDIAQDPFPEVSDATAKLVDQLIANPKFFKNTKKPDGGLVVVPVLGPAVGFAFPGKKSMVTELADLKIEAVEREVILSGLTRIIDPGAPRLRQLLYSSSPYGLVVVQAEGVSKTAGLRPNDLLIAADGEKLSSRYVLDRHLALGPSRVLLKRAGEVREVTLAITSP